MRFPLRSRTGHPPFLCKAALQKRMCLVTWNTKARIGF
jgi:hypothetical protein